MNWYGHSTGYFPTPAAYAEYLTAFAKDLKSHGWSIPYWNIGNEVPIWISKTYAEAFAVVFNAGAGAIHSVFPNALVGSDVLTAQGRMSLLRFDPEGRGLPRVPLLPRREPLRGSEFCIPNNVNGYLTDPSTLAASYPYPHSWQFISPRSSQLGWHNLTGHWLPVLDTETNLNTAQSDGSDPRLQTLFDAAWLAESYITASAQSMKGVVSYSLLSAYPTPKSPSTLLGAWGFGLGVEPTSTTETLYAPYWAAELWGSSVPAGAKELEVQTANSYYVPAIAVHDGSVIQFASCEPRGRGHHHSDHGDRCRGCSYYRPDPRPAELRHVLQYHDPDRTAGKVGHHDGQSHGHWPPASNHRRLRCRGRDVRSRARISRPLENRNYPSGSSARGCGAFGISFFASRFRRREYPPGVLPAGTRPIPRGLGRLGEMEPPPPSWRGDVATRSDDSLAGGVPHLPSQPERVRP